MGLGESQRRAWGRRNGDGAGGLGQGRQASRERVRRPRKRGRLRQIGGRGTGMSAKKARSRGGDRAATSQSSRSRVTARISWRAAVWRRPRMSRSVATCFCLGAEEGTGAWGPPDTLPAHLDTHAPQLSLPELVSALEPLCSLHIPPPYPFPPDPPFPPASLDPTSPASELPSQPVQIPLLTVDSRTLTSKTSTRIFLFIPSQLLIKITCHLHPFRSSDHS